MKDLVWVVVWRRRGPVFPLAGPPPAPDAPPLAFYLSRKGVIRGWVWASKPAGARLFRSRAEAERARLDANAGRTAAVCCVRRESLLALAGR